MRGSRGRTLRRSFVAFTGVAVWAAPRYADAALPTKPIPTTIAISSAVPGTADNVHGYVTSPDSSCLANRAILLFKGINFLGQTLTDAQALWSVGATLAKHDPVLAKVEAGPNVPQR